MAAFRPGLLLRKLTRQRATKLVEYPAPTGCLQVNLAGKAALVTGGTGQVGRAICKTLGACGADVIVQFHSQQSYAEALCAEIRSFGVRSIAVQADVTSETSIAQMRTQIAESFDCVDIVVINAIAWHKRANVLKLAAEEFNRVHATSVLQTVHLAQAFAPRMIERQWGRFIAISSEVAMQALVDTGPYTAAKRGMDGVLRVLTREVGPHGITVNSVAPGWIITDRDRSEATERQDDYQRHLPLRHRGVDQDVANATAFLASNLAAFITGTYLPVCGGNVMPAI